MKKTIIISCLYAMSSATIMAQNDEIRSIELINTEVTASRIPIPADKATRIVQVLTSKEIEASAAESVSDLLKLIAGVDVRQRGVFGIQTDIGVNGGNEDQLTVLLNGVNISSPHTGHLTMDLPTNINDIERIEVIEGGASRVYGSSAFSGAINIITKSATNNYAEANLSGGSYGSVSADGQLNLVSNNFANHFSGSWSQSDGASANSDFKKWNLYWNEKYSNDFLDIKAQAGYSNMKYGANTFYGTGSNSQYEENSRYIFSLQGETKGRLHVLPQVYWNRSYDHYVWIRSNPTAYQNYHQTTVFGTNINAWTQWALGKTAIGFEFRRENILSTRLGKEIDPNQLIDAPGYKYKDGRSNYGLYVEHDVLINRWSISVGMLANKNTSLKGGAKLYPGIDVSYCPMDGMRVYASFNQSLRTPTYTDLYYNGPGLVGNSELKPEKSTDYSLGWSYRDGIINTQVKGFYRKGSDMIDWVKKQNATVWTTANSDIDNIGIEGNVAFDFRQTHFSNPIVRNVIFSYCYNYQHRVNEEQSSNYASQLIYLRHKFVTTVNHRIVNQLSAQWEFVYKQRTGWFENALTNTRENYGGFCQLDLKLKWTAKHYEVYVKGNNLTSRKYYDIANVQQPGAWFMAGMKYNFGW